MLSSLTNVSEFNKGRQKCKNLVSHVITSVSRKIILADIANLAEIACIADIA